jgi:DNA-3-methyladenine glycosylase I
MITNILNANKFTMTYQTRCFGNKPGQDLYAKYHDEEWGIPSHDDRHLFEMLILEGAQAGLNWETILKKREGYKDAFYNFDVVKVANMSDEELETLRLNPNIVRNKLKIKSARQNARVFIDIQNAFGSFDKYIWAYVDHKVIKNSWSAKTGVPVYTPISESISKDLKKRGMSFVGPTIMYAYMQSIGMVNDHLTSCWCNN